MEQIDSDRRLQELYDLGVGFIFNDFEGDHHTQSSMDFNKLHRASCVECDPRRSRNAMTVRTSGQKIWFETFAEAAKWLLDCREGNYSKCTKCDPR